jgi:hypothetical protein
VKTTKLMAFAITALLTVLLSSSAQAQKGTSVSFKGIEVTAGHSESDDVYGWMCYAKTTGALSGNLTLTMDYEGGLKAPGMISLVNSGNWTLPVYAATLQGTTYQGALYGTVETGEITWSKYGDIVELKLAITGGTQSLIEVKGTATLYGSLSRAGTGARTFDGTMFFEFQ